jgi:hypothetical protein
MNRALLLLIATLVASPFAAGQKKVIFDQDTDGIIGGNNDPLVMLLQSKRVVVLGVRQPTS